MKKDVIFKSLLALILIPAIVVAGFFGMLFSSFAGGDRFYTPLIAVSAIVLIILLVIGLFHLLKRKAFWLTAGACLLAAGLTIGGYEINQAYHNSFAAVNEQGVDLSQYEPFRADTKVVTLDGKSSLSLVYQLPKLDGATALYPLYAAFARAVYPEGLYEHDNSMVMSSNTVNAYASLIKGDADIIFAAQPSKRQLQDAEKAGVELNLTPIGREAFVFFVQADNPVTGLTKQQIQDIYSGKVTNWKEVGGKNARIRAFQRPENSGSQTMLQKVMEGRTLMTPPKKDVAAGMGGIIQQTADYRNYPNAIGYSFLFFATEMVDNGEIRLLEVDGVKPDRASIGSGAYPLSAEFYAVTAGTPNPNAEAFIDWILSSEGQRIVELTGYTPIK